MGDDEAHRAQGGLPHGRLDVQLALQVSGLTGTAVLSRQADLTLVLLYGGGQLESRTLMKH